jgi:hypothetical protein
MEARSHTFSIDAHDVCYPQTRMIDAEVATDAKFALQFAHNVLNEIKMLQSATEAKICL